MRPVIPLEPFGHFRTLLVISFVMYISLLRATTWHILGLDCGFGVFGLWPQR